MSNTLHRSVVLTRDGSYVVVSTVDLDGVESLQREFVRLIDTIAGVEGSGRYETMVFASNAAGVPSSMRELDVARTHSFDGVLQQHDAMVVKWALPQ